MAAWTVSSIEGLNVQNTVLRESLDSVSCTSLYTQLLIFGDFLPIHIFMCTGIPEPRHNVLLIGL